MRKVTVNHAVKQSLKYPGVRLALTPFSVILVCLDNEGLVEESFKLADRCSAYVSTQERMEWAELVLQAFLKIKIRYEAQQVGVNSWRVASVHDDNLQGGGVVHMLSR